MLRRRKDCEEGDGEGKTYSKVGTQVQLAA